MPSDLSSCAHPFAGLICWNAAYKSIWYTTSSTAAAEEEKAAEEAEAAVAAREATPEVSEEGEIPVDPEEMEEISKAQQQAISKPSHQHSPSRRHTSDRGPDRGVDRDRGPPSRERYLWLVLLIHHSLCL